eukprot:CAMPEP_0172371412 /NCGR_PEP_ID=MMETSP1060-20121228/42764_1 /TAXON_ID=37318 /ORGANISM="Pseudo-nitzschia pungens, Strain cf. cingulata" /LENGTH=157 /DNA_ID=CAMNT_0013097027 /DNA_START=34 /DNA_END=504 /DNA_ORIENTATION=-
MTYAKRREMEKSIEKLRVETFNRSIIGQDVELGPGAEDTSTDSSSHDDDDDDDSSLCVSFSPSNAFLLQAMEGATAKAKTDIEAAKKLAILEINAAIAKSYLAVAEADRQAARCQDRKMGLLVLLFLLVFAVGNNPVLQSQVSSMLGIDGFRMPVLW